MRKFLLIGFLLLFLPALSYTQVSSPVTNGEYYIDTDPGEGNGTPLSSFDSGTVLNLTESVDISGLSNGSHWLCIRYQDSQGNWGLPECRLFNYYNQSLTNPTSAPITNGEYYIDLDPGEGNGTPLASFTSGTSLNLTESVDFSGLSNGTHWLCIRYQDEQGNWGMPECRLFNYLNQAITGPISSPIVNGEYYIDSDPGEGNGTQLASFTGGTALNLTESVDISSLSNGTHWLCIRYQDEQGNWSLPECRLFNYLNQAITGPVSAPIVSGEYYIDTDPGEGNGTILASFTSGTALNLTESVSISGLNNGTHWLCIRYLDDLGNWGMPECRMFNSINQVPSSIPVSAPIVQGEYFFDDDPGQGNGTPFTVTSSNTVSMNGTINVNNLSVGQHFVSMRFLDEAGNWGFNETQQFNVGNIVSLISPANGAAHVLVVPEFTWSSIVSADNYEFQLSIQSDFATPLLDTTITETTFIPTNPLDFQTLYYWRVKANISSLPVNDWSAISHFTTQFVVELISPSDNSTQIEVLPKFVWHHLDNAASYNLQVSNNSDFSDFVINFSTETDTSYQLLQLFTATQYYWRVIVLDNAGQSYNSDIWNFMTGEGNGYVPPSKNISISLALHGLWNGTVHSLASVTIELRDGNSITSSTIVNRKSGIVNASGNVSINFADVANGNYWLIVRSPGYLPLAIPQKISLDVSGFTYDFTSAQTQAIGGNLAMIQATTSDSKWMARVGDLNSSRNINSTDANFLLQNNGKSVSGQIPPP